MKYVLLFLFTASLVCSCANNKTAPPQAESHEKELSVAEKIALAHGIENWDAVTELNFTFNVDRDKMHSERSWTWRPKTHDISMRNEKDTVSFNRNALDSLNIKYDAAFINDAFWLLAPFHLVWDQGTTLSEPIKQPAPIMGDTLSKITLTYGNEGGYTPGDAYDFFYDDDYKIKEWIFRQGNNDQPSMKTTWEAYENFNGLHIAKTHRDSTGGFTLYFTNISVKK